MADTPDTIRNFVIIAHIDHGKSTLADRFLELTGTIEQRKMREQFLDQMDLEREKGITIKMQPVRMLYRPLALQHRPTGTGRDGYDETVIKQSDSSSPGNAGAVYHAARSYILNLIDTPGHVDFGYEVSRALAAVEGAILLVDATQGVQAQTIANLHLAREEGLTIIPVINKIDLPGARVDECKEELTNLLSCDPADILRISAKTGEGVREVLDAVLERVPPPSLARKKSLGVSSYPRALIFDSHFDSFRGIIAHVRVFDGVFQKGDAIRFLATKSQASAMELGYFFPALEANSQIRAGEIGYIATGLKNPDAVRVGDTIAAGDSETAAMVMPLAGYREPKPVVFASIYPEDPDDYTKLLDALKKIALNDAAVRFEPESSDALGRGFRVGFLGMLHLEIAHERLRREYGIELIVTTPSVAYLVTKRDGSRQEIYSASRLPDASEIVSIEEPWVRLEVITPQRFLGNVMAVLQKTRGDMHHQSYMGAGRIVIAFEVPLKDILVDFFDSLKSVTEGYGSFSYEPLEYRAGELVRLDILIAGEREEAFSQVVPEASLYHEGRRMAEKLKELLPKQLFAVSIQASAGGRVVARETLPALKKDVTGYLYGGDRTRKMKLWKKQQRGKKRLRERGRVDIPSEVFLKILKR